MSRSSDYSPLPDASPRVLLRLPSVITLALSNRLHTQQDTYEQWATLSGELDRNLKQLGAIAASNPARHVDMSVIYSLIHDPVISTAQETCSNNVSENLHFHNLLADLSIWFSCIAPQEPPDGDGISLQDASDSSAACTMIGQSIRWTLNLTLFPDEIDEVGGKVSRLRAPVKQCRSALPKDWVTTPVDYGSIRVHDFDSMTSEEEAIEVPEPEGKAED